MSLPAPSRRGQFKRRLKSQFLGRVLVTDNEMPFRSGFAHELDTKGKKPPSITTTY